MAAASEFFQSVAGSSVSPRGTWPASHASSGRKPLDWTGASVWALASVPVSKMASSVALVAKRMLQLDFGLLARRFGVVGRVKKVNEPGNQQHGGRAHPQQQPHRAHIALAHPPNA